MLPKINLPTYTFEIPSTGKKYLFRPYVGREEKILLTAREASVGVSNDELDLIVWGAIRQIVNNCSVSSELNIDDLTTSDLEYLFVRLRSISISNIVNISYNVSDGDKVIPIDFEIDIETQVKIEKPAKVDNKLMIDSDLGVTLRWPRAIDLIENTQKDDMAKLAALSIKNIFNKETVFEAESYSPDELRDFVLELPIPIRNKIEEYVASMPRVSCELKYKLLNGDEKKLVLSSVFDFFIWY